MRRLCRDVGELIRWSWYSLPLAVAAALGYGTRITTVAISIDDLCRTRYLAEHYFGQNRFGGPLFFRLLGITELYPFAEKLLSVLLLAMAATLFCVLFARASGNRLHRAVYPAFACLFVTYPLIAEVWNYSGTDSVIALSMCFCALSLLLLVDWLNTRRFWRLAAAGALVFFSLSFFESIASVFITGTFAVLILRYLFEEAGQRELDQREADGPEPGDPAGDGRARRWGPVLRAGLVFAAVLAAGALLRTGVSFGLRAAMGLAHFDGATNTIAYGQTGLSFLAQLAAVVKDTALKYFFAGFYYFPIGIFGAALVLSVALCVGTVVRTRRALPVLLTLGLIGSCFALGLLQGATTPYRAAQPLWLFCAFVFMLVLHLGLCSRARVLRGAVCCAACMLCLYQAMNLNKWFSLNYLRSEEDARAVSAIAERLNASHDPDKPVVFVGTRGVSEHLARACCADGGKLGFRVYTALRRLVGVAELAPGFRYTQTCVSSYFEYAVYAAYDPTTELLRLFDYYGYSFAPGTQAQWLDAHAAAEHAPSFPLAGSILELPEYTVVKLGPIEWDGWRAQAGAEPGEAGGA